MIRVLVADDHPLFRAGIVFVPDFCQRLIEDGCIDVELSEGTFGRATEGRLD